MCDLHSRVTRDVLVQIPTRKDIVPGHPVDTFRRENEALRNVIALMKRDSPTCRPCLKRLIPLRLFFAFASRSTI